jgi:hypothetical protein
VVVADADNGAQGDGAVWDFSANVGAGLLPVGATTQPRRVVFRLAHPPDQAGAIALSCAIHVFADTLSHSSR